MPPEKQTPMGSSCGTRFSHLAISYQEVLFFRGGFGHWKWLLALGAASVVFFLFAYFIFDRLRDTFAEEV